MKLGFAATLVATCESFVKAVCPTVVTIPVAQLEAIFICLYTTPNSTCINFFRIQTLQPSQLARDFVSLIVFVRHLHILMSNASYLLATCTFTPLYGRLCNVMGRRGANRAAVLFCAFGTLACGLSQNMPMLIASRFVSLLLFWAR